MSRNKKKIKIHYRNEKSLQFALSSKFLNLRDHSKLTATSKDELKINFKDISFREKIQDCMYDTSDVVDYLREERRKSFFEREGEGASKEEQYIAKKIGKDALLNIEYDIFHEECDFCNEQTNPEEYTIDYSEYTRVVCCECYSDYYEYKYTDWNPPMSCLEYYNML